MTILTIVSNPVGEPKEVGGVPKVLEALSLERIEQFARIASAEDSEYEFDSWLDDFIDNDLYIISTDNLDEIKGFITAKHTGMEPKEDGTVLEGEGLKVTAAYSHPRNLTNEEGLVDALLETSVLLGYRYLSVPNTTELMRNLADYAVTQIESEYIEVMVSHCDDTDLFDLKEFKTYKQLYEQGCGSHAL